jgi:hypothetical protein
MVTKARSAPTDAGTGKWWPSKYGADDQAGALNEITPAKVLEAESHCEPCPFRGRPAPFQYREIPAGPAAPQQAGFDPASAGWKTSPLAGAGVSGDA